MKWSFCACAAVFLVAHAPALAERQDKDHAGRNSSYDTAQTAGLEAWQARKEARRQLAETSRIRHSQEESQKADEGQLSETQDAQQTALDETLCTLCEKFSDKSADGEQPLRIEIISGLDFSRMALAGSEDGSARIDPATGSKVTNQGLIDLGGMSFQGRARVTGTALRQVRIELPHQVTLSSPMGEQAELTDFVSDVPAISLLDARGTLEFQFGARLSTMDAAGGNFRGRIPIRVDYN